jgi:hypothetical protein
MSETTLCNSRNMQKSKEGEKKEINILELFDHESMEFALSNGFYDNRILKELQVKSEEKGKWSYVFFKITVLNCAM